ncbi:hypothetical protein PN462_21230 [Spirulina sp. CS-785/01]|uniref:slr1957 family protein n=1 Tax=Spirulina sp. CS-785/01 TaxID=3021716 RepID=UPI00232CAD01|nr:hypothetical protein [Spirulina sp. CS-785/01]MDB9315650.1 hypothetical protein [Spirulina sp. CS-785/01]
MRHYSQQWIQEWCDTYGWTEVFRERSGHYWAFPPNAVMPEPIPQEELKRIKSQKGWCREECLLIIGTVFSAIAASFLSYSLECPLPLVFAFALGAITTTLLEMEEE